MTLGISSYSFPWNIGTTRNTGAEGMSAGELLNFAKTHNISRVQYGDNLPLHRLNMDEIAQLSSTANRYGVQIEVGMRGLLVGNMLQYLKLAETFSSPFVRVVIDDASYMPHLDDCRKVIREVLPAFSSAGVIIAIENHDRFSSQQLIELIEHTDSEWVAVCLDTANSFGALEGTYETVRTLAPYAINLHIKDIIVNRVATKMGFQIRGAAAGEGMIDMPYVLGEVNRYHRCISGTLELWSDFHDSDKLTMQEEKEAVIRSINYLKNYIQ